MKWRFYYVNLNNNKGIKTWIYIKNNIGYVVNYITILEKKTVYIWNHKEIKLVLLMWKN